MQHTSDNTQVSKIEQALERGVPAVLSDAERSDMKRTLFAHIDAQNTVREPLPSPFFGPWMRFTAGAFAVLCVMSMTGVAAEWSLPGEPLYAVKLDIVEPVMLAFELPDATPVAEHVWRLERRLSEVRALQAESALDATTAAVVIEEVTQSVQTVEAEADGAIRTNAAEALQSIDRAAALIDAHDSLLIVHDTEDALDVLAYELDDARDAAVEDLLTETASSSLAEYVDVSIDDISATIDAATLSDTTHDAVEAYMEEALHALDDLSDTSLAETVEHVSEANQRILIETYLAEEVSNGL